MKDLIQFITGHKSPRQIITDLIGDEEAEKFAEWAWGKDYQEIVYSEKAVPRWNQLHGDKLEIHENGALVIDIPKMVDLWKNEKDCQTSVDMI